MLSQQETPAETVQTSQFRRKHTGTFVEELEMRLFRFSIKEDCIGMFKHGELWRRYCIGLISTAVRGGRVMISGWS
jgi:hypothetical protein